MKFPPLAFTTGKLPHSTMGDVSVEKCHRGLRRDLYITNPQYLSIFANGRVSLGSEEYLFLFNKYIQSLREIFVSITEKMK